MRTVFVFSFGLAVFGWGCASEVADPQPFDQQKSFGNASPVEHGNIAFRTVAHASLQDEAGAHAWDFQLPGRAEIRVTGISSGTGSVSMELYQRRDESQTWAEAIREAPVAYYADVYPYRFGAPIDDSFGPGDYHLVVSGSVDSVRGPFQVVVGCEGNCGYTPRFALPDETGFGESCGLQMAELFAGDLVAEDLIEIERRGEEPFQNYNGELRTVLELYSSTLGSVLDQVDPAVLSLKWLELQGGALITVGYGRPEHDITYGFSNQSGLLLSTWQKSTPVISYYCRGGGEFEERYPASACVQALLNSGVHYSDGTTDIDGTYSLTGDNQDLDPMLEAAAMLYLSLMEQVLNQGGVEFDVNTIVTLEALSWGNGARVYVDGAIGEAEYLMVKNGDDVWAVTEDSERWGNTVICETPGR